MTPERSLDLICLGRAAVDLYGDQIGSPLEEMQSFSKYVGGCAANIAVGTARLGLATAMLTRVGDEPMGRFVRDTLAREGVDVRHVTTDPQRLTGLVILGIRDRQTFPLIFYRENCADMAIVAQEIDPELITSARALLVTGTHFSQPGVDAASRRAIHLARTAGTRVVLDVDYRPVLWGLTGHGLGQERFIASDRVSNHMLSIVSECDLVVGTEEEIHIVGGSTDTLTALRHIRQQCDATLVLKRGPLGCVVFPDAIPDRIEDGIVGKGFSVEVLNTLGAGDAFMSGFLRGWIRGEPLERCCFWANACGALVVSRHGCAPAMPSAEELDDYLARASEIDDVRQDERLAQVHRATTQRRQIDELPVFAFDNRLYLEELARQAGVPSRRLAQLKDLFAEGALRGAEAARLPVAGAIIDDRWGEAALWTMTGRGWWIARAVERSGDMPLRFEHGPNVGLTIRGWPREQVVKCLVRMHPDDNEALALEQLSKLEWLYRACVKTEHELVLEILPPPERALGAGDLVALLEAIYVRGIRPDWFKLEPQPDAAAYNQIATTIENADPYCHGILVLGGGMPLDDLAQAFAIAGRCPACKGFAVGRSIFGDPARAWLGGEIDAEAVIGQTAERFARVIELWRARKEG